jgi:hypothetical protein
MKQVARALKMLCAAMTTGAPVNWARHLPKPVIDSTTTKAYDDNTTVGEIISAALTPSVFKSQDKGVDDADRCETTLQGEGIAFMIWPDTEDGGLNIYAPNVPHALQPCADPVTITLPQLRTLGVSTQAMGFARLK